MAREELWIKYRPSKFAEVVGQDAAVKLLQGFLQTDTVPHAILFSGQSGCGKTTMANILAHEMGCVGMGINKFIVNCATVEKPLDTIRDLGDQVKLSPSGQSKCRVWILEEIQSLTRSQAAQHAILLMLEDASKASERSYIFCCTTDPGKLKEPIRNRCKKIEVNPLSDKALRTLLAYIATKEGRTVPAAVVDQIIDVSNGSAREAVNQLDSALAAGDDEDAMLEVVSGAKSNDQVWQLFRALVYEKKPSWTKVAPIIKDISDEPERFRHAVLKVANTEMLKGGATAARAYFVHDVFRGSWEYCPESGLAGACWEVIQQFLRQ